jgi:integrase
MCRMEPWYRRQLPVGSLYQRKGRYWYAVTIEGKRICRPLCSPGEPATTNKAEAVGLARELYRRLTSDQQEPADLLARYREHEQSRCCDWHLKVKMRTVRRFLSYSGVAPDAITARDVNHYLLRRMADGVSAKTAVNERGHLCAFCRWLVGEGLLPYNVARDSDRPKLLDDREIIHLTRKEWDEIVRFAWEQELYAVLVAMYSGLRRAEIMRMRWVDLQDGADGPIIQVRMRKGRKHITKAMPMHPELVDVFKAIPRDHDTVFPPLSSTQWQRYLRVLRLKFPTLAGRRQGWQTFRRTVGTFLLQNGANIAVVSKVLRHSNIATTSKAYAHLLAEAGRDELNKL